MSILHVEHKEIVQFAEDKVNLPREKANEYRSQARRLRDRLESYLDDHPTFSLKRMLLSGSLAKGTALRSINDIDVACYVMGSDAPRDLQELLEYLANRLRTAFPNFSPEQVQPQHYSVTVSFRGTGLDVDIVPILYEGDPDWYGNLISQEDGSFLETSIPLHLEFTRRRKDAQKTHFAQSVRLAKFWVRSMKAQRDGFRFKSFMVELIFAKLVDAGVDLSNYPEALQAFFTYIARSNLAELIFFTDYYAAHDIGACKTPVKIIDPVNAVNNVARLYTRAQADQIVEAALDAGDAIDAACHAPTKQEAVRYWQRVFGSAFQV